MRTLTGDHCRCAACGEHFNSTAAFDMHRIGKPGVDRRCRTPDAMRAAGMAVNRTGWWVTNLQPEDAVRRKERRSAPTLGRGGGSGSAPAVCGTREASVTSGADP